MSGKHGMQWTGEHINVVGQREKKRAHGVEVCCPNAGRSCRYSDCPHYQTHHKNADGLLCSHDRRDDCPSCQKVANDKT